MLTFELTLSEADWTEVLDGGSFLAFDKIGEAKATVLFTETSPTPSSATEGNDIHTWTSGWDFEASGLLEGVQRIWLKGNGKIRGVRG